MEDKEVTEVSLRVAGLTEENIPQLLSEFHLGISRAGSVRILTIFLESDEVFKETMETVRNILDQFPEITFLGIHQDLVSVAEIAWRTKMSSAEITANWLTDPTFPPAHDYLTYKSVAVWEWEPVLTWALETGKLSEEHAEGLPTPVQAAAIHYAVVSIRQTTPQRPAAPTEPRATARQES